MFTGIITALGHIRSIDPIGQGHDMRLVIETPFPLPVGAAGGAGGIDRVFGVLPDGGGIWRGLVRRGCLGGDFGSYQIGQLGGRITGQPGTFVARWR